MTVDTDRGRTEDRLPGPDRRRRPHRPRARTLADQARRRRAHHRQDRRAGDHLARDGRPGSHPGTLPPGGPFRRRGRGRRQGRRASTSGSGGAGHARVPPKYRRGIESFPLCVDLPAGRPRAIADRTAGRPGSEGGTPDGVGPLRSTSRKRASGAQATGRLGGGLRGGLSRRLRRRAFDREGGVGDGLSRRDLFRTLLRRRRGRGRPGGRTAKSTSISRRPTSWPSFPSRGPAASVWSDPSGSRNRTPRTDLRRHQRAGDPEPEAHGRQGELVLDLSRASPRGGANSARAARSCSETRPTFTARSAVRG